MKSQRHEELNCSVTVPIVDHFGGMTSVALWLLKLLSALLADKSQVLNHSRCRCSPEPMTRSILKSPVLRQHKADQLHFVSVIWSWNTDKKSAKYETMVTKWWTEELTIWKDPKSYDRNLMKEQLRHKHLHHFNDFYRLWLLYFHLLIGENIIPYSIFNFYSQEIPRKHAWLFLT